MAEISILGSTGKPILYASLNGGDLRFQFEYYARTPNEGDYEFIHTVKPADFPAIAAKFGLDPNQEILTLIQENSNLGHGEELKSVLTDKEIKNEFWSWYS